MSGLVRRAAPLLIAGAAGAVMGRWMEARRHPRQALPPVHPASPPPAVAIPERSEPEPEPEVVDGEETERPGTVDFEALAGHPALSHRPPPDSGAAASTPAEAVRAALAQVSPEHAGAVRVEVHDGVAYLRGEVASPEAITAMDRRARDVSGVRSVENLLHLPGTPPPLASERR